METKHLIALTLLVAATFAGAVASALSRRICAVAFFLLVSGSLLTEWLDVNFFTHYWYRGTTRGLEFSVIDVLAVSVLAGTLLSPKRGGERRWFWPAGLGPLLFYVGVAAISVAVSMPRVYGAFELSKIVRGVIVFLAAACHVRGRREVSQLVMGISCAVGLQGLASLKQHFLDDAYRVAGSLDHPNSLSMYLCLTGPLLVAGAASNLPRWQRVVCWAGIVLASLSSVMTVSRAGVPIFALVMLGTAAFCVSWRPTLGKVAMAGAVMIAVAFLAVTSWRTLGARYAQSTLASEYLDPNIEGRGFYLRVAGSILDERFMGVGLNNWSYWVSKTYGRRQGVAYEDYDDLYFIPNKEALPSIHYAAPAHSLAALTAGELGWPGLVALTLLWGRWFFAGAAFLRRRHADPMRVIGVGCFFGMCGLLLQSTTEWTYRQTPILFTCHLLLGSLVALYHLRRKVPAHAPSRVTRSIEARVPEPVGI